MRATSLVFVVVLAGCLPVGCTHSRLAVNTVRKAETLNDIYQKQVLDNLAKFLCDANSLPHFAVPSQGTTAVNDTLDADGTARWNFTRFDSATLGAGGARQMQENWVLLPVTDPRRLERMRCAYQMVVMNCGFGQACWCSDCDRVLNTFYTGDANDASWQFSGDRISPASLTAGRPWFGTGKKCDLPTDCDCLLVGRYCDQYVWVYPSYHDQLAKLTLVILDFATNDAKVRAKKQKDVTIYLDANGNPTAPGDASQVVQARVDYDVSNVGELGVRYQVGKEFLRDSQTTPQIDGYETIDPIDREPEFRLQELEQRLRAIGI